jgi:hypothetical protein
MKVIITEHRVDKIIRKYLDDDYYPDFGWGDNYQEMVDKFGDLVFFINDMGSYVYYGCNANAGPQNKFFEDYGSLHNYKCPLLSIYPRVGEELTSLFGNRWLPVFKEWFEENTGLKVTQIITGYGDI